MGEVTQQNDGVTCARQEFEIRGAFLLRPWLENLDIICYTCLIQEDRVHDLTQQC